MITSEQDSLMAPYGIGFTSDTVDVCESWTGSDYSYMATGAGSSDNVPGFASEVQSAEYQGGYITGYGSDGSAATGAVSAGGTSFDFLYADDATRQASYDYPYYGVSSPDPSACLVPPCPAMSRNVPVPTEAPGATVSRSNNAAATQGAYSAGPDTLRRFLRHGLLRRGVRALVDAADEIGRSPEGYRRFRAVRGDETVTWSVDPVSQLLVGEESAGPSDTTRGMHTWARVSGGYVRERSVFETVERIAGRRVRSTATIRFANVRVSDPKVLASPLTGPVAGPALNP